MNMKASSALNPHPSTRSFDASSQAMRSASTLSGEAVPRLDLDDVADVHAGHRFALGVKGPHVLVSANTDRGLAHVAPSRKIPVRLEITGLCGTREAVFGKFHSFSTFR